MSDFGIDDMVDEIVKEYREKIRQAVKRAEVIAREKIENDIIPNAVDEYYGGYSPKYYWRQYQLYKSLGPYSSLTESNNVFTLKIGVEDESPFGPDTMFHRGKNVQNDKIFDNFLDGKHPNVPTRGEDLHGTNTKVYVNALLDELIENELMPLIDSAI